MPIECKFWGESCEESCVLMSEIKHQAILGGTKQANLKTTKAVGPFWKKDGWRIYTKNFKFKAIEDGCSEADELVKMVDTITIEKEKAGELI